MTTSARPFPASTFRLLPSSGLSAPVSRCLFFLPLSSLCFRAVPSRFWILSFLFFLSALRRFRLPVAFPAPQCRLSTPSDFHLPPCLVSHTVLPDPLIRHAVCFFSSFPASLPQPFHRCSPSLSLRRFPWRSLSFVRSRFRLQLLSLCFFLSALCPVCLTVASGPGSGSLRPLRSSPSSATGFPSALSGSAYSASCLFPFVPPCFAPTAVPQVLAFALTPALSLALRFLASAHALGFNYSAFCFFVSLLFSVLPHSRLLGCFPNSFVSGIFPSSARPDFSGVASEFQVLRFLFVSFRTSLLRSHSCSTGASLLDLSSGINA